MRMRLHLAGLTSGLCKVKAVRAMPAAINTEMPQPGASTDVPQPGSIGNYRWVICALLFIATTINYIDRQILSLLKEILDQQIGWTNEQFGWVNSAFQLSYGIGLLGFGWRRWKKAN